VSTSTGPIKKTRIRGTIATRSHELRLKTHATLAAFVRTQINTGLILCQLAKQMPPSEKRDIGLDRAQAAFDTAQEWIWKLHMPHSQFDEITACLERLRFELNNAKLV
jgi:hypothetical protein